MAMTLNQWIGEVVGFLSPESPLFFFSWENPYGFHGFILTKQQCHWIHDLHRNKNPRPSSHDLNHLDFLGKPTKHPLRSTGGARWALLAGRAWIFTLATWRGVKDEPWLFGSIYTILMS
jgi:hypothetical protein